MCPFRQISAIWTLFCPSNATSLKRWCWTSTPKHAPLRSRVLIRLPSCKKLQKAKSKMKEPIQALAMSILRFSECRFPSRNQQTPMVGYMPRLMPRYFVGKVYFFGRTHLSTQSPMQPTILILGFSQAPVQKQQIISADWPKTPLLTRFSRNYRDCKNVENLHISSLMC